MSLRLSRKLSSMCLKYAFCFLLLLPRGLDSTPEQSLVPALQASGLERMLLLYIPFSSSGFSSIALTRPHNRGFLRECGCPQARDVTHRRVPNTGII